MKTVVSLVLVFSQVPLRLFSILVYVASQQTGVGNQAQLGAALPPLRNSTAGMADGSGDVHPMVQLQSKTKVSDERGNATADVTNNTGTSGQVHSMVQLESTIKLEDQVRNLAEQEEHDLVTKSAEELEAEEGEFERDSSEANMGFWGRRRRKNRRRAHWEPEPWKATSIAVNRHAVGNPSGSHSGCRLGHCYSVFGIVLPRQRNPDGGAKGYTAVRR